MKKTFIKRIIGNAAILLSLLLTSCYSVFNGGTGGMIVDAESTSTPKAGIAYVDVYAYTDSDTRDSDYNSWREGTVFSPSNNYYGHTSTDTNGNFTISNIVWKSDKPEFGKDADYTTIYLLFYHENYGLTKGSTVITSDSTSDTVYAELTSIKKTTALNISINDVANSNATPNNVLVKISVPQNTETLSAKPKVYEQIIAGNSIINISYPRWKNAEDKAEGIENTPEVSITYAQSAGEITWKACANADNENQDYAFYEDDFSIVKTIKNSSYNISLFGKATRIQVPVVSGTYGDTSSPSSDGKVISMMAKDSSGAFTIDCGEDRTKAQTIGNNGTQTHGNFSGLGSDIYIDDATYTGKYKDIEVQFYVDGTAYGSPELLRSNKNSDTFTL